MVPGKMKSNLLHRMVIAGMLIAASATLTSCMHKELCFDHRHLTKVIVNVDWAKAPFMPTGSHVAFYNIDDPTIFYYFDMSATGGEVEVPMGNYNVICFNNDSETILFRNEAAFSSYEAYTRVTSRQESSLSSAPLPKSSVDSSQNEVLNPTNFYRDLDSDVTLRENQVNYVSFQPDSAIVTYTYEVNGIQNLKLVTKSSAYISGISGSMFLGDGSISKTPSTVPVETAMTTNNTKIEGSFTLFGHEASSKNYFTLYLWSNAGNFYSVFNVTDQVKNYPDQKHVHIVIDAANIYIPEPISEGGGVQPTVSDWEDVNEDIQL
jgi:hypothetical protein